MSTWFQPWRLVAWGSAAMVAIAHIALLWDRVQAGELQDPTVAGRWVLSAAFVAGIWQLRRMGLIHFWGRRALIFWLAVVLLHAAFLVPVGLGTQPLLLAPPALFVARILAISSAIVLAALGWTIAKTILDRPFRSDESASFCLPLHGGFRTAWNDRGPPSRQ